MSRFLQVTFAGIVSLVASAACTGDEITSAGSTTGPSTTTAATTGAGTTSAGTGGGIGGEGGAATTTSAATGGSGGVGGSGGIGDPSDVYPAPHGAPPKVHDYGGPVLASPVFIPVYFSNDVPDIKAPINAFLSTLGASNYWAATTQEYGVGPATAAPAIELAESAPDAIDDAGVKVWLKGKLDSDDPAFGAPPDDAVYVIYYPVSTVITRAGKKSCEHFGGYHTSVTLDAAHGGKHVAFAGIPRCSIFYDLVGLDVLTGSTSHELIEAATDPYVLTGPAYAALTNDLVYWETFVGGGEVADLCTPFPGMFPKLPEIGHAVQRSWSNAAAKQGHEPCVPAPVGSVYFNAVPVMKDHFNASIQGQIISVRGVKIPVGTSRVVDIQLFSDAPTGGPFTVDAFDKFKLFGGKQRLEITLDATSGQNGQTLHATITVLSAGADKTEPFIVTATLGGQTNYWFGLVGS